MSTELSYRPLTWIEQQMTLHSAPLKKYVNEKVDEAIAAVKIHVESRMAEGKSIRMEWEKGTIAGIEVNPIAHDFVYAKFEVKLQELGLGLIGNQWKPGLDVVWIPADFRALLSLQWGELTEEQFEKIIQHYKPKEKKENTAK